MKQDVVRSHEGKRFHLGDEDVFTIKREGGERSLTHLVVQPGSAAACHTHPRYEETFFILEGELEFTLRQETFVVRRGDYIVAAAGVRHGYANRSSSPVEMLFEFAPGGMEALFYEFRTDEGPPFDGAGYLEKAREVHGTLYELD